jgi:uncharacterized protein YecT (DUF1311 family)
MKYLATVFLLALVSVSAGAQDSTEYRACNDKANTQTAMNSCAGDEAARVDLQLNDIYRALLQKATNPSDASTKIKAAERAWIAYRDTYLDAMYPAANKQAEYGSVYPMEVALLRAKLTRRQIEALQDLLQQYGGTAQSLPKVFVPGLSEVKARTRIPVLLPSAMAAPIGKAEYAVVEKANKNEYAISLYYELGVGDSGFAAFFAAEATPNYNPRDLNVQETTLAHGIVGLFSPLSCGGSCSPVNLWWQEKGFLYQIQLKLPSTLSEQDQKKAIMAVADSAIIAGPR